MKRRGMTLVELMAAMAIMGLTVAAMLSLFVFGTRTSRRTIADVNTAQTNSQALRRISETLREAATVSISNNGTVVTYQLPQRMNSNDPVTGERELIIPVVGDGVNRTFTVSNGTLTDSVNGRVLLRGIMATDPEPDSTQFNQTYPPFQLSTIGSRRAVTIQLITSERVGGQQRVARLKTTTLIRNSQ